MQFWIIQTLNSLALGGLLFLLAAGFSLIFGLMRIANLTHGSLFMLGAYVGVTILALVPNLWLAALVAGIAVAVFGGLLERLLLRPLTGNALGQVLVTLGVSFIVADLCLVIWGGDPIPLAAPPSLQRPLLIGGIAFPAYRLFVLGVAMVLWGIERSLDEHLWLGEDGRLGSDLVQLAGILLVAGGIVVLLRTRARWLEWLRTHHAGEPPATAAGQRAPATPAGQRDGATAPQKLEDADQRT